MVKTSPRRTRRSPSSKRTAPATARRLNSPKRHRSLSPLKLSDVPKKGAMPIQASAYAVEKSAVAETLRTRPRDRAPRTRQEEGVARETELQKFVAECFPGSITHSLDASVLQSLQVTDQPPNIETTLLLSDQNPPCLLVVAEKKRVLMKEKVRIFGNILARELTSVLQGHMAESICIVPVFTEPQSLHDIEVTVEETLDKVRRLVPYGCWQMTQGKLEDLEKAIKEVLK